MAVKKKEDELEHETDAEFEDDPSSKTPDPDFEEKPDIEKEDEDQEDENEFDQGGYEKKDFYANLAEELLDETELSDLVDRYLDEYLPSDKEARSKRDEQYEEGIKRTGVSKDAPGGADFQGASRAVHPGLAEACVDFNARSMKELMPPSGPVRIKIDGRLSKDKLDRAERKRRHMNWQMTTQISEYRPTLEQVLTQLPLGGAEYIKFYPDFLKKRPACEFVRCEKITFPYNCTDFYNAQRFFHEFDLSEFEFRQRVTAKLYIELSEDDAESNDAMPELSKTAAQENKVEGKEQPTDNVDNERPFIDVYMLETIKADTEAKEECGAAPYIMTIDVNNRKVVALYRNWEEDDKTQAKMDWVIKFGFIPWDGPLEIGLPHLIGSLSGAATGTIRCLLDAGLTQTIPTGVMLKGTQVTGQTKQVGPCKVNVLENRTAGLGAEKIGDIFQHIPYNPVSPVLLELLQFIDGKIGSVVRTTAETSNDNQNMPVGTKLANIEQALTVFSAIHQRLHEAQAKCLAVIHRINRMYMEDSEYDADLGFAVREDYIGKIDVQPVSDPNIYSESQRYGQLQAVMQLMQVFPQGGFDQNAVIKWALATMRIPNSEEIFPDKAKPRDENPTAENIMMCLGQPAIALPDQDHPSHLRCLLDFAKSPLFGSSPLFKPVFIPLALQHAKQHILYWYGSLTHEFTEAALGVPISEVQDEDSEVSKKFSQVVSLASPKAIAELEQKLQPYQQLLQEAMQFVQQIQQQNQASNPNPLHIEAAAQQADAQAKQADAAAKQQENQIKQAEVAADAQNNQAEQQNEQQRNQIAADKNQVELVRTGEDNQTALDIASMRAVTGKGTGGFKNGESLG